MAATPKKRALVDALLAELERRLDAAEAAARFTHEAATHEEARPENDKDTRALEQSYLARGQAARTELLAEARKQIRLMPVRDFDEDATIQLGAAIDVEVDTVPKRLFLAPAAGGVEFDHQGTRVFVVTPEAPVGRALAGLSVGDEAEVRVGGRTVSYEIVELF